MTQITATCAASPRPVGALLREWRQRRRLSQLDLACEADISTKHLSFLETGRSVPSRDMVLHLAERLDVPLRARNALLNAAGYAPAFPERPLDDAALTAAREAIDLVLTGHEPHPALAVDRHWYMAAANRAVAPLVGAVDPALLRPPVNVMRLGLHPSGLAPRTVNLAEWRAHLLERLRQQIEVSADPVLVDLLAELRGYPAPEGRRRTLRPGILPMWRCRFVWPPTPGCYRSSAPRPCSARRSISRCRNWRWNVSSRPTEPRRRRCGGSLPSMQGNGGACGTVNKRCC